MGVWVLFKSILSLKIYFMLLTRVHRHRRRKVAINLNKQKWKTIVLTVVLIGIAVFLCLLLLGTFAQAAGLVDDTVSEDNLRSEEHTSELQSRGHLVCRLLLEKKKK